MPDFLSLLIKIFKASRDENTFKNVQGQASKRGSLIKNWFDYFEEFVTGEGTSDVICASAECEMIMRVNCAGAFGLELNKAFSGPSQALKALLRPFSGPSRALRGLIRPLRAL